MQTNRDLADPGKGCGGQGSKGHPSASGKQGSMSSCAISNQGSSSCFPDDCCEGSSRKAQPFGEVHDSLVTAPSTWSHSTLAHEGLRVGTIPEAGFLRSASASPRCCLQGSGGPWSPVHTAGPRSPLGSHSLRASAEPDCRSQSIHP